MLLFFSTLRHQGDHDFSKKKQQLRINKPKQGTLIGPPPLETSFGSGPSGLAVLSAAAAAAAGAPALLRAANTNTAAAAATGEPLTFASTTNTHTAAAAAAAPALLRAANTNSAAAAGVGAAAAAAPGLGRAANTTTPTTTTTTTTTTITTTTTAAAAAAGDGAAGGGGGGGAPDLAVETDFGAALQVVQKLLKNLRQAMNQRARGGTVAGFVDGDNVAFEERWARADALTKEKTPYELHAAAYEFADIFDGFVYFQRFCDKINAPTRFELDL